MISKTNKSFMVTVPSFREHIPIFHKKNVSSITELNKMLDEGLSDIKFGRVISSEIVNKRLQEKYGI